MKLGGMMTDDNYQCPEPIRSYNVKLNKGIDRNNPVWCNVMKMHLALNDSDMHFQSKEYLIEKLQQILMDRCYWHKNIDSFFDDQIESLEKRYGKVKDD